MPASRACLPLLRAALLAATLAAVTPAFASFDDELASAAAIVEANAPRIDAARDPEERAVLLRESIEAIGVLQGFAAEAVASEAAREELRRLGREGLTPDVLGLSLADVLLPRLGAGSTALDVEIKAIVAGLADPAYRSAGWAALARAHMALAESEEAERLAERAIDEAKGIDRAETRNGALRGAVLAAAAPGHVPAAAAKASDLMNTASARAGLYQDLARLTLRAGLAEDEDLPEAEALADTAREALAAGRLREALSAAQAMDRDEKGRDALLGEALDAALGRNDEALALEAAKSFNRNKAQDEALRRLVDRLIEAGHPLRGLEIAALIIRDKARADAEIAVSDKLREGGYRRAAVDVLQRIELSPADEGDTIARIVDRLAAEDAFEAAGARAASIAAPDARSRAYSRLAKRLADAGRIEEARALLERATRPGDLSFAQGGLVRALALAGRIGEAEALAERLTIPADRDRALEALAEARGQAGDEAAARDAIGLIGDPAAEARALAVLAEHLGRAEHDRALAALDEALQILDGVPAAPERGALARAFAGLGDLARADATAAAIADPATRAATQEALAVLQANQGDFADAGRRMEGLAPGTPRDRVAARIALARFQAGNDLSRLVEELRPLPYDIRVPTFREAAEREAAKLDRRGWIDPANAVAGAGEAPAAAATRANFSVGHQLVTAPVADLGAPETIALPDVSNHTAAALRAQMPAPSGGAASIAILGFSPFSQEAFKLTAKGREAIFEVQQAQKLTWPRYIAVESGTMSFGQLMRQLPEAASLGMLSAENGVLTVRVPVVVLPGASLVMSGQEFSQYRFSATTGAFLAVAGDLAVQDTTFIGWDEALNRPAEATEKTKADFRPFITAWGGSTIRIAGSRLAMLGYDSGKAYGLTQSSGAAVQNLYRFGPASPKGDIVDNTFENLRYGYYSYEADGVFVVGNEYRDNVVYGIDPHDRSHGLVIALNTAYGTFKKHGIIVSREVNDSFIFANLSVDNHGSGIMLDRQSLRNVVYANTARSNGGDGLSFYESGCNIALANTLKDNRRAGIKVRNSAAVALYDNLVEGNEASGADIYASDLRTSPEGLLRNFVLDPFEPVATTILGRNRFVANRLGINSAGATTVMLDRNAFSDQRNQVFSGDLRLLSSFLLRIGQDATVAVDNTCQPEPSAEAHHGEACRLPGFAPRSARAILPAVPTGPDGRPRSCTAPGGSPQAKAALGGRSDG